MAVGWLPGGPLWTAHWPMPRIFYKEPSQRMGKRAAKASPLMLLIKHVNQINKLIRLPEPRKQIVLQALVVVLDESTNEFCWGHDRIWWKVLLRVDPVDDLAENEKYTF